MRQAKRALAIVGVCFLTISCGHEKSRVTGWNYNDPKNGGFEKVPYAQQETGPGLVLVQGGTFTMGQKEQDVNFDWNNIPQRKTVSSFYMDETEVTNFHWLEYLYWLNRVYGPDYPEIVEKALPDTNAWRRKLGYNEPYVEHYLRHPSYRDYPVVGVNWLQANEFCKWRTDRVNEFILIREGLFKHNPSQINQDHFDTESYYADQYESGKVVEGKPTPNPNKEYRNVKKKDGILLPKYRLPTEAEWEFAAYALIGNTFNERIVDKRIYPWNGHWVRNPKEEFRGDFQANFVRGRGDYMGVAGDLNDKGDITTPVYSYWPNDYGLYNMAGNVSEWTMDVYRPLTGKDANEFSPHRGNIFKEKERNIRGGIKRKRDMPAYDIDGMIAHLKKFMEENGMNPQNPSSDGGKFISGTLIENAKAAKELKEEGSEVEANTQFQENVIFALKEVPRDDPNYQLATILLRDIVEFVDGNPGQIKKRRTKAEDNLNRRNYTYADHRNHLDGDQKSSTYFKGTSPPENGELDNYMYDFSKTTLINDKARVYKGGSWADRAYWMSPGTRRFLQQDQAKATIGFRCAMSRLGSPVGLGGR